MQKTERYGLNLLEYGDPIGPEPLNENTRTVESTIAQLADGARTITAGSFVNAGAGWQSFTFPQPFAAAPTVVLQPENFDGSAMVKDVSAEGFSYRLTHPVIGAVTQRTNSCVIWSDSSSYHYDQFPVLNLTFTHQEETAERVAIHYIAVGARA